MTLLTNSFEGGTSGTALTTGNSGGASGSALDALNNSSGTATSIFDSAHAAHGGLGWKLGTDATAATVYGDWTASIGTNATVWVRLYCYITAAPAVQYRLFAGVNGASTCGAVLLKATGLLNFNDSVGGTVLASAAVPLNSWFRLEAMLAGSATTGQWQYKIWYNPDSTGTPDDTQISAATQSMFGSVATCRFGISGTTVASAGPFWLDDIGASTTGYIGPAVAAASASTPLPPIMFPPLSRVFGPNAPFAQPRPQPPPVAVAVAVQVPAPLMRPVVPGRAPGRARLGSRGLCAAALAVAAVLPQPAGRPYLQVQRPAPAHRAIAGGITGPQPVTVVTPVAVPAPRQAPRPPRGAPAHRVAWQGRAAPPRTGQGPPSRTLPATSRPPHRVIWRVLAGPQPVTVISAVAVPPPGWRPQPRQVPPHRAAWRAVAGGPNAVPPGVPVTPPPRVLPQVPRKAAARALWRARAVAAVTGRPVAGTPRVIRTAPHRALWRGLAAPPPPAVPAVAVRAPRLIPQPRHLPPARARYGHLLGPANAPPPPPAVYGTARQGTMTIPAATAGQGAAAHAESGTGAPAAYGPVYGPVYSPGTGHAEAGQMTVPAAASGQMTIPHAEGGQP